MNKTILKDYSPYLVPFLLFAVLTYLLPYIGISKFYIYPAKILIVFLTIIFFWSIIKKEIRFKFDYLAFSGGIFVFFVWIAFEGFYPIIGNDDFFNPFAVKEKIIIVYAWILIRIIGASFVVPIVEELFWRSFATRVLIDPDIKKIPFASFSWFSFFVVSIAFGFEHYRWLPGIIAGMIYCLLYYRTKNLFSPIISHGTTNLMLGIYVIVTGQFEFW